MTNGTTVKISGTEAGTIGTIASNLGNGWYKVKVYTLSGDRLITVSENQLETL